jgi:hypothetical protein
MQRLYITRLSMMEINISMFSRIQIMHCTQFILDALVFLPFSLRKDKMMMNRSTHSVRRRNGRRR